MAGVSGDAPSVARDSYGSDEQYRSVFEASVDGILIGDLTGRIVEASPSACAMYGYTHDELVGLNGSDLLHPDSWDVMREALESVGTRGARVHRNAVARRKDGSLFYVNGPSTPFTYRGRPHILAVIRDVTDQVEAERRLREQSERLQEREEQYRRIFESSSDGLIINDPSRGVVVAANPAVCRMHGYTSEEFIGLHANDFIHPDYHPVFVDFLQTIMAGGTYQCEAIDVRKDGSSFHVEVHGSGVMYQGRRHILAVVRDVSERVQVRELLEQRVEERTRELSTLLEVSRNVTSTLELQPLLDLILDQLKSVVDFSGAGIVVQEGDEMCIVRQSAPDTYAIPPETRIPMSEARPLWDLLRRGRRIIIDDVLGQTVAARAYQELAGGSMDHYGYIRSWMAVPMKVKDRELGALFLAHSEPGVFDAHSADLAGAIAQQAAIAIENARLYEKAQEVAVLEERQRLARELHDSVTQALFGINVGAQTAHSLLHSDPGKASDSIEYVRSLARTGMAEMRSLIFELRPESLQSEGLAQALQKQADAFASRHEIPVDIELCEEPSTTLQIKEALYRIAQEALQNAVKHARPTRVGVRLQCHAEDLLLEVWDDGLGFDTGGSFPGHLGLRSMRERAARLGGNLELESEAGRGTRVRATIPSRRSERATA